MQSRINQTVFGAGTLALLAGACTVIVPYPPGGIGPFRAEADFSLTQDSENVGTLNIDWRLGKVEVRVDPTATAITASGKKVASAESQSAADAALAAITIDFVVAESFPLQVTLRFDAPADGVRIYGASLEVVLPAGLALNITNASGDVAVTGNTAATSIDAELGTVAVQEQVGNVTARVDTGSVTVESTGGDVVVQTNAGSIDVSAAPAAEGTILADADYGSITLRVPADFAATLDLETDLGDVDADLSEFTVTDLESDWRSLSATLNGGGGRIEADCSFGSVDFGSLD